VIHGLGVHAPHQADVVRQGPNVRQHLAQLHAALAVFLERLDGGQGGPFGVAAGHGRETGRATDAVGDVFTRDGNHLRLGIE
jgi:hypothetical protein